MEREENSDAGISVVAMLSHQYPRRDDNWRSARAVRSRDNKLAKKNEQNKELKTINKSLHQRVRKLESTLKESEHNNYLERKAARTEAIQVEREHSGEIRRIQERHANELSQTHAEIEYAYAKAEWEESTRIAAEQVWKEKVREEKRLGAMALMKLRKMHRKEISGLRAVIAYLHKQQQNATILYKSKQDASIRDERTMISAMQKRIDAKSAQVLMLKEVISELNAKHDKEINEMELWMNEMTSEVTQAMRDKKSALAKVEYDRNIAAKRLQKWTMEKMLRRQAEDNLAKMEKEMKSVKHELEVANRLLAVNNFRKLEMKKEWSGLNATNKRSRRGGSRRWPVWVVQVICELLVSGTPPSAIPSNLLTLYMVLYNERPKNIPSVSFVRHCRIVIEVIGETLAAIKLANCPSWDQLWTDATTRQQIPFTALIIGVLTDNGGDTVIDPVVVSSCIFLEDETSESQAEGIKSKVSWFHCIRVDIVYR